jgi:hypothetical protein
MRIYEQRDIIIKYNYCYIYVFTTSWRQIYGKLSLWNTNTRDGCGGKARYMHLQYHTHYTHTYIYIQCT